MIEVIGSIGEKSFCIIDGKEKNIKGVNKFIQTLSVRHLMCLKQYRINVRKILNMKYNIPIYFSSNNLLMPCKPTYLNDCLYINYQFLLGVSDHGDKVMFIFKNGDYFFYDCDFKSLKVQFNKCEDIINYYNYLENF